MDDLPASPGMGARGVTRPMALQAQRGPDHEVHADGGHSDGGHGDESHGDGGHGDGGHGSHGAPYSDARYGMLRVHHRHTLWVPWLLVLLGLWMLAAPFLLGYLHEAQWVRPSGGRGVWFSDATHDALRARLMLWSDVASGLLLVVFGWRALRPDRPVSWWLACGVGVWLSLAPLVFWAPTSAAYLNSTLVGALVIGLTVLVPGMPNMVAYMRMGGDTPPGWSYNPSSWPQRGVMIAAGFLGWLVSRYLAAYQLGYLGAVWDPFFGDGSRRVLDSPMSHAWPVSDAGLGALAYTFEFLMGWMGSPARWRTMPWMVTFFGVLVIPLGLVHIVLVIAQPVVVGQWCLFCLVAAAIMLPMIPLEVDEVVAMAQHVRRAMRRGTGFWAAFWKGGPADAAEADGRTPALVTLPDQPWAVFTASLWGMSFPPALVASSALGVGLMAVPGVFGLDGWAAHLAHLGGALAVTVAVIAMGEVVRALRYLNVPLGLAVAVGPWIAGGPAPGLAVCTVAGLAVAGLALPRGRKTERYDTWDRLVV